MEKILIIGTGGLAREASGWFDKYYEIVGYSSTDRDDHKRFQMKGLLHANDVTPEVAGTNLAVIAIGSPKVKSLVYEKFTDRGFVFPSLIHPTSTVSDKAKLDDGVVIAPNCVVGPGAILGKCVYVNFCVGIGHDVQIGSFVQINPGVQIGGFAKIGAKTLVGSGATVLAGVQIGNTVIVGSGSACFAKVRDSVTVMGNPARRMRAFEND